MSDLTIYKIKGAISDKLDKIKYVPLSKLLGRKQVLTEGDWDNVLPRRDNTMLQGQQRQNGVS